MDLTNCITKAFFHHLATKPLSFIFTSYQSTNLISLHLLIIMRWELVYNPPYTTSYHIITLVSFTVYIHVTLPKDTKPVLYPYPTSCHYRTLQTCLYTILCSAIHHYTSNPRFTSKQRYLSRHTGHYTTLCNYFRQHYFPKTYRNEDTYTCTHNIITRHHHSTRQMDEYV